MLRRIARLADGWFPLLRPDERARAAIERLRTYAREAGRDPAAIGIEGSINVARGTPEEWARAASDWEGLGATHVSVNTMNAGLATPGQHIEALRRFKEAAKGVVGS